MQMDRFTIKAAEAVQLAQQRAEADGHAEITPLHLLAALIAPGGNENGPGIVLPVLEKAGAHAEQIRSMVASELDRLPKVTGGTVSPAREFVEVLENADAEARRMKDHRRDWRRVWR